MSNDKDKLKEHLKQLRDTSIPVKDRLKLLRDYSFGSEDVPEEEQPEEKSSLNLKDLDTTKVLEDALKYRELAKDLAEEIGEGKYGTSKDAAYENFKKSGDLYLITAQSFKAQGRPKRDITLALHNALDVYQDALKHTHHSGKGHNLLKLINKLKNPRKKSSTTLSLSIASFVLALFFSALNITGNAIGSTQQDFSILGILFFVVGLVFIFVYAKSKR